MKDKLLVLAIEGIYRTMGIKLSVRDIELLEGSADYVRFAIKKHENIEYSVRKNEWTFDNVYEVTIENTKNDTKIEFN